MFANSKTGIYINANEKAPEVAFEVKDNGNSKIARPVKIAAIEAKDPITKLYVIASEILSLFDATK